MAYAEKVFNDPNQVNMLYNEVRGRTLEELEADTKMILGISISQLE